VTAYEILLLFDPELPEDRQGEIVARARELVDKSGGTWRSHDPWGRRKLAYEIQHKTDGVYHLVVFDSNAETLAEVTRVLKITDGVLRHLAVRHIEGSRTTAPRDEPIRDDGPRGRSQSHEQEYAAANVSAQEEEEE
jgi:small subunit ribosomal protein S6